MKILRKRIGLVAILATAFLFAACMFDTVFGVADLSQPRVVGQLSLNEEQTRAYVGQLTGGTVWNAVSRIASIDVTTGTEMGTTPSWSGMWTTRAVTSDTGNDHVWTLHDNGAIVEWPLDLGAWSSWRADFVETPGGMTNEMFCDIEMLASGHFVATGIALSGGQYKGYFTYIQPHPAFPGDYYKSYTSWYISPNSDMIRSCPRVSTDNSTGEVVFLTPDTTYGAGGDQVNRYELYSWDGGSGNIYWGLSFLNDWTIPENVKWLPDDITSEYGKTIVQFEYINPWFASANGRLKLYDTDTATEEDDMLLYETRAIDMVDYAIDSNEPAAVLWWVGHDNTSNNELGMISFKN